jgi:hypothetical protein
MPRAAQTEIRMRLIVEAPVSGVVYSLQNKQNQPIDAKCSAGNASLVFEFPVRLATGNRFSGEHVRREGPTRRSIYVAVGKQAGDATSCWDRRIKIDIHTITRSLLDEALNGKILEASIRGAGQDGTPACATVSPTRAWRAV